MYKRETLEQAGLRLVHLTRDGQLIVHDPATGLYEEYCRSPHYAGYALVVDGMEYEFCRSSVSREKLVYEETAP